MIDETATATEHAALAAVCGGMKYWSIYDIETGRYAHLSGDGEWGWTILITEAEVWHSHQNALRVKRAEYDGIPRAVVVGMVETGRAPQDNLLAKGTT